MGANNNFDRDKFYWDDFYSKDLASHNHSLFSEFVWDNYLKLRKGRLIELGCGNGRDSLFFAEKGISVTAIDASDKAINKLKQEYADIKNANFICGDFVSYNDASKYLYCYSRFSIHAITEVQEKIIMNQVYDYLEDEGRFFIEVRSVNDELYGKGEEIAFDSFKYDDHFRRFIRIERLIRELVGVGFVIDYAAERRGFAPYKGENPLIIRIVGKKQQKCEENE